MGVVAAVGAFALLVVPSRTVALGAPPDGDRPRPVSWSGNCTEVIFAMLRPADEMDAFVPDEFVIRRDPRTGIETGDVLFAISAVSCDDVTINGKPSEPFGESFAGVDIKPPAACTTDSTDEGRDDRTDPTCGGDHGFQFWSVHDSRDLAAALAPHGAPCPTAPCRGEVRFAGDVTDVASALHVTVDSADSSLYSLDVTTVGPMAPLSDDTSFDNNGGSWYLGPHGPVRRVFLLCTPVAEPGWDGTCFDEEAGALEAQLGEATLTAEPGSFLAELIGGTSARGLGIVAQFRFEGLSRIADSPGRDAQ